MTRLWSRVGVRVTAVALLVLGVVGGVYLGQGREVQQSVVGVQIVAQSNVTTEADEMELIKARQAEHAAARAYRTQAEGEAATKAASEAKAAAAKARKLEQKVIATKKDAEAKAKAAASSDESSSGTSKPYAGPIPSSCNEYSGNRKIGCALMIDAGFGIDQFPCLDKLWTKESGWRVKAYNSGSGATGIAQALPGSKMASVAADWRTNPVTQIKWGLGYIEGRYGSPCKAWAKSQSSGWY